MTTSDQHLTTRQAAAVPTQVVTEVARLDQLATQFEANELSERTKQLYERDWNHFAAFCERHNLTPIPASVDTVRWYIADLSRTKSDSGAWTYKASTMVRRLAAIAWVHKTAGQPNPTRDSRVRSELKGIRRDRQSPTRRMRPLLTDDIRTVLDRMTFHTWPDGVKALRDALVIVAEFASGRRSDEIAALRIEDLRRHPKDGLHLRIRKSKTDQTGEGQTAVVPFGEHPVMCGPCLRLRWLRLLAADGDRPTMMRLILDAGPADQWDHVCTEPDPDLTGWDSNILLPVLRRWGVIKKAPMSTDAIYDLVVERAAAAGYHGGYGSHSLRAGHVTTARRAGASARSICNQTGHSSERTMLVYDREYAPGVDNSANQLGL